MTAIDQEGRVRSDTGTPARAPDACGFVERDGVRIWWESYGSGEPAILLLPSWSIVSSRHWKCQIADLARRFRVVTFDGRGNGQSDRPLDPAAYPVGIFAEDAAAVLDAAHVDAAVVAGLSLGGLYGLQLAAAHPQRVLGLLAIGPSIAGLVPPDPARPVYPFDDELEETEGWARFNRHSWLRDWPGFLEFFFSELFCEPHSTKQIEDCVAWGLDTTPEVILAMEGQHSGNRAAAEAFCRNVRCPVLVLHGSDDRIQPLAAGRRVAELTGGELVVLDGAGHGPQARDPVRVNLLLRGFAERVAARPPAATAWTRAAARRRRVLVVTSPIGLGHAWRDVRIVDALRRRSPGIEVEWLAQDPVTRVLSSRGETIHPASAELAHEAAHIDRETGEHELNAFQALRRLDEIFCANFMLFHDVAADGRYDLWIADEAWEVDHFLHENPELKTAAYAWLTDFVGYLPLPEGGEREAMLTADLNAELIEHVERYPRVRDRALFVGEAEDVIPASFGPGLPQIPEWTARHHSFVGSITAYDPAAPPLRAALRAERGWGPHERVCVAAVGGSAAGAALLRRIVAAAPAARERVPGLRLVVVAGPRLDPSSFGSAAGVEVLGYVHELHRLLAACDVAVVQGGLTTTMELVAAGVPFVSLPLRRHFEQRLHVRHRLDGHGARDWLEYADATPAVLADAIAAALARGAPTGRRPTDGAERAARELAALL